MNPSNQPKTEFQSIKDFVERPQSKLKWAKRIDFRSMENSVIEEHVLKKGLPMVISNTTLSWKRDREMFGWDWLKKNYGNVHFNPRDSDSCRDLNSWSIFEYIDYLMSPQEERNPAHLLAHNLPCPPQWKDFISQKLSYFFVGGDNDLLKELLLELQPSTLVTQLGDDDSCLPGHFEVMGSLGNSVMVYSEEGAFSVWICAATEDKEKAIQFWNEKSIGSLFSENEFLSLESLAEAPFPFYVIEQREGDLVLLPSESAYQVVNKNGKSVKVCWSTLPHQTIWNSYVSALPSFRAWGKPELFKIKATAYYSLINRVKLVEQGKKNIDSLVDEFPPLLSIVEDMIASEWIDVGDSKDEVDVLRFTDDNIPHRRSCDFCKCDIWNRCYHCSECGQKETGYDICFSCVAQGRGCLHKEKLVLMEYISMKHIKEEFENAKEAYQKLLRSAKRKKHKKKKIVEWKSRSDELAKQVSTATIAHNLVKLYGQQKLEYCHQCEKSQSYAIAVTVGCNKVVKQKSCELHYCTKCLWNRYAEKLTDCFMNKKWVCPSCRGKCNCRVCLEKKNIKEESCEDILNGALNSAYPFSNIEAPNVPAVSDSKPVFHTHALKKRKMFTSSANLPLKKKALLESKEIQEKESKFEIQNKEEPEEEIRDEPEDRMQTEEEIRAYLPPQHQKQLETFEQQIKPESAWHVSDDDVKVQPAEHPKEETMESVSPDLTPLDTQIKDSYGHHIIDHTATILVRNLSYNCTAEDLQELFRSCGEIDQITIPVDRATNKLRGFGFVKFKIQDSARKAMETMQGARLKDRNVELEWSVDKNSRKMPMAPYPPICYKCGKAGHFARNCLTVERDMEPPKDWDMGHGYWDHRKERGYDFVDKRKNFICYKCGKEGHVANNCLERDDKINPSLKGVICYKCKQEGHLANQCDKRIKVCFICRKDGHIAVECTEKQNFRDFNNRGHFSYEDKLGWDHSFKYQKPLPSRESPRIPGSWEDREAEFHRKGEWDDRDPKFAHSDFNNYPRDHYSVRRDNYYDYRPNDKSPRYRDMRPMDPRMNISKSSEYPREQATPPNERYLSRSASFGQIPRESLPMNGQYHGYNSPISPRRSTPHQPSPHPIQAGQTPTSSQTLRPAQTTPNKINSPHLQYYGSSETLNGTSYNIPPQNQGKLTLNSLNQPYQNSSSSFSQPPPHTTPPSVSPKPPFQMDSEMAEKRKLFKNYAGSIVVNRLSRYFHQREISSRDEFKQISRHVIQSILEREHPNYRREKDTEFKIAQYVDNYFEKFKMFKKTNQPLDKWFSSSISPP